MRLRKKARIETERILKKSESTLLETKSRFELENKGSSNLDKDRKSALKEIRALRDKLEALEIDKDEQERLTWKLQEEFDSLSEQTDAIHRTRVESEKELKILKQRSQECKEEVETNLRVKSNTEKSIRDLHTEIEDVRDQNAEEEDRNRELQAYKNSNLTIIQDLKKSLDREISSREALEESKKN